MAQSRVRKAQVRILITIYVLLSWACFFALMMKVPNKKPK
jgi:hypothetical protein